MSAHIAVEPAGYAITGRGFGPDFRAGFDSIEDANHLDAPDHTPQGSLASSGGIRCLLTGLPYVVATIGRKGLWS